MINSPDSAAPSTRRAFLAKLAVAASALAAASHSAQANQQPKAAKPIGDMVVYKDPNCGCCKEWVKHMQKAGFVLTVHDTADMDAVKANLGVPKSLASCHTGRIGRYSIEGHVPADVIAKLLTEQPVARGLAVPGMPQGSPGMETGRKDPYDVILFDAAGKTRVYASR